MAVSFLPNITEKGALAAFNTGMETISPIYEKYALTTSSTSATETYPRIGYVPVPRVMNDSRNIQSVRDFKFNVTNDTHELTLAINREDFEDDQISGISTRIQELGQAWSTYYDSLFADLLAGGSALAPIDDVAYFSSTRTIGDSGTIDNALTAAAATGTNPTTAEFLAELKTARLEFRKFKDDQGRPFNQAAATKLAVVVPPDFESAAFEALTANFISQTDNVFKGMADIDVLDYLTAVNKHYVFAIGGIRKPFLFQARTALEIQIDLDPNRVAERNAVYILTRRRFKFTYGDPRMAIEQTWT